MKFSLAVALLLNWVDASSLQTETTESLDDLSYLEEGAQGASQVCAYNMKRLNGRSNSLETFYKANSGSSYWHDPSFRADKMAIAWGKKWGRDENDTMWSNWKDGKNFKWLRPSQQLKKSRSKKKFSLWGSTGKPQPQGVEQGELTTCWFLAPLSAVAEVPERISNGLFQKTELSKNGVYRLRFWVRDQWQYVNVNDQLPTYRDGSFPFVMPSSHDGAWWAPIAEKAFAKLNVNWDRISLGYPTDAFRAITGGPVQYFEHPDKTKKEKDKLKVMYRYFADKNFPMTTGCCQSGAKTYGLSTGHVYTLLDIVDLYDASGAVAQTLVKMRNPWASETYKGPWSDKSKKWTKAYKEQVNHKKANDGIFYMDFDYLLNNWRYVSVAMLDQDFIPNEQQHNVYIGKKTRRVKLHNPVDQKVEIMFDDFSHLLFPRKGCMTNRNVKLSLYNSKKKRIDWSWFEVEEGWQNVGTKNEELPAGNYYVKIENRAKTSQPRQSVSVQIFSNKQKIGYNQWK